MKNAMKLSDAILKGCQVTKPISGSYYSKEEDGSFCACTFGAAYFGVPNASLEEVSHGEYFIENTFGINILKHPPVNTLPLYDEGLRKYRDLFDQVTSLNDNTLMTREDIAMGLAAAGL